LYEICFRTGKDGGDASDVSKDRRLLGEVYLGAYLALEPEWCFVIVNTDAAPDDAVVGYVLGTPDTQAFEERLATDWWPELRERYPLGIFPEDSYDAGLVRTIHAGNRTDLAILTDFPAHLHVDLLPESQGGGNGRRLLNTLFDALRDAGVPGIHLGVSLSNTTAIGFYNHLGFRALNDEGWQLGLDLRTPQR
jgi:ribosomal protein S18 acetylase RimI-like enzyme